MNIRPGTALGQQAELALRFSELIASAIYGTVVVFHRHLTPSNGPDAPLRGTGARRQTLPCNGLPAPLAVGCSDLRSVRVDLEGYAELGQAVPRESVDSRDGSKRGAKAS